MLEGVLGFIFGALICYTIVRVYSNRVMYGGELIVDRSYTRPEIYLKLDRRYSSATEVSKQRYILLRVRTVRLPNAQQ